ncbi:hypothetical protein [Streptomyces sp. SID3343]|uniref:hypothetical protein n=1 Tax=Streptomyces sp. SID3343 TaxID=2690260 RepID=UPI0013686B2F|nr:hypothetical protein [Streptomyces sp. SID3343]MYW00473.1 hypothetical protein [Streptomyces sp. SID3343]
MTTIDTGMPGGVPASAVPPGAASEVGVELRYALTTEPFPVAVSPASGAYHTADLTIVLTRRASTAIECGEITVSVPVGSGAGALAAETAGMTAATDPAGWSVAVAASGQVTFGPPGGSVEIGKEDGLALSVGSIPVNRTVGRSLLTVAVHWRVPGESGTSSWSTETVELPVTKFPPTFSLGELYASPGRIAYGDSVTLTWQASGGDFRLLYNKADISVTDRDSYVAHNITRDTLFQLRGTSSSSSGELEAVRSAWVTVDVADVSTPSLTVTRRVVTDRIAAPQHSVPQFSASSMEYRPELSMRIYHPMLGRWGRPARLPFGPAGSPPGVAVHDDALHLLFRPYDSEELVWATYDGSTWRTLPGSPGAAGPDRVALVSTGSSLFCAYRAPNGEQLTCTSTDGTSWGAPSPMPAPEAGAVSLCWDGTALHAALRSKKDGFPCLSVHTRDDEQQWRNVHDLVHPSPVGSPELVLQEEKLRCFFRALVGEVYTISRPRDGLHFSAAARVGVRASNDFRAVAAGPGLTALFPDSEGVLHTTSYDPDAQAPAAVWSPAAPIDEYRTTETPALTWYGNRLIAIGRGGAFVHN